MLQISQRPLTGSDADQALFVDRTVELDHLRRSADLGFNVLVLGDRGIGVTSLVRQHLRRLEDAGWPAFYSSALGVESFRDLLTAIRIGVAGRRGKTFAAESMMQNLMVERDPDPLAELRTMAHELAGRDASRRPIIVLDDMHDPELVHELFGRYRDEVWELPLRWVVCGVAFRRAQYLEPPADVFFDSELSVGPLDEDSAVGLLEKRLAAALDEHEATLLIRQSLGRIVERGDGSPRHLLSAARDSVLRTAEELDAASQAQQEAENLGAAEARVLRHLLVHGPASASDSELLENLGFTRSRATQVLRRLEEAGLLTWESEQGDIGRPRKVYHVTPEPPKGVKEADC